jgi:hypothetical protein
MPKRKPDWVTRGREDDCLTACVSKLLDINYDEVPYYGRDIDSQWLEYLRAWASKKGYRMYMEWVDSQSTKWPDRVIGVGKSPSGRSNDHAVIVDSQLNVVWDPEYNKRRSIREIGYVLVFKERNASSNKVL